MRADSPSDETSGARPGGAAHARSASAHEAPVLGEFVDGYDVPVINERTVRASAGLLFVFGIIAFMTAAQLGDFAALRLFGIVFLIDMMMRLAVGTRFTPSLIIGGLIVRRQRPEWVGAEQKKLAWGIGLAMAFVTCLGMGWLHFSAVAILVLAATCLLLLFIEAAFGVCLGCEVQRLFGTSQQQQLCAGDVCAVNPQLGAGSSPS